MSFSVNGLFMIEVVSSENIKEILPLIRSYQAFYNVADINDSNNHEFFSQFGSDSDTGCLFGYRVGQKMVAFATVYFSFSSTIAAKVAVMNDLYIDPDYRRQGIAKALILHCEQYGRSKGAARLQWVTAADNLPAQSLYLSLGAKQSSWEHYVL